MVPRTGCRSTTFGRRQFIARSALAATGGLTLGSAALAATDATPAVNGGRGNRIAVSTYSFWHFRGERTPIETCIDEAAAMGFDGVEILQVQMADDSNGHLQQLKRRAFALGLDLCGFSTHQSFVFPGAERRRQSFGQTLHSLELAYRLGIPTMRIN